MLLPREPHGNPEQDGAGDSFTCGRKSIEWAPITPNHHVGRFFRAGFLERHQTSDSFAQ